MEDTQKSRGLPPVVSAFLVVLGMVGAVMLFGYLAPPPEEEPVVEEVTDEPVADPFAELEVDPREVEALKEPEPEPEKVEEKKEDPFAGISKLAMDEDWKAALGLASDGRRSAKSAKAAIKAEEIDKALGLIERAQDSYERAIDQGTDVQDNFEGADLERVLSKIEGWKKALEDLPTVD